jgi:hypothetical protein
MPKKCSIKRSNEMITIKETKNADTRTIKNSKNLPESVLYMETLAHVLAVNNVMDYIAKEINYAVCHQSRSSRVQ